MSGEILLNLNLNDFCSDTDEELAVIAKNNRGAAAALVLRYVKLISIKAGAFASSVTDCDDLRQEGLMGLLSAINAYNPSKNAKFSTFAEVCIINRMKSLLLKSNRTPDSFEDIYLLQEQYEVSACETPESIYLYKEYFSELLDIIDAELSEIERKVLNNYARGFSYRDIAEKLGLAEKSVDNAMQRARRKIRGLIQSKP